MIRKQGKRFLFPHWLLVPFLLLSGQSLLNAQTCPSGSLTVSTIPNTSFPAGSASAALSTGASSISIAASGSAIAVGDILLIIQMQGAQIKSANAATYGANGASGLGYLTTGTYLAGKMEYVVANSAVTTAGGTLTLKTPLVNSYQNSAYSTTSGQYTYQIIRVPTYNNLTLSANITAPPWNGATGGVIALNVTGTLNMNGFTIDASGAGFRGGGGVKHGGAGAGTTLVSTDFMIPSTSNTGGSKGEGLAGTPRWLNNGGTAVLDQGTTLEGYPGGSIDRGAPGNAGGGATDGAPASNSNNAGGGGGGNGGLGGNGGNSWSSNLPSGGVTGAAFGEVSASRLVMGGGGGAGSSDGGTGDTGLTGFASSGSAGGGIILINTGSVTGTGSILANGADAGTSTLANDGGGGGGAGGSIVLMATTSTSGLSGITLQANGGAGASNTGGATAVAHGPGGGGGGGAIYSNGTFNAASSVAGGLAGTTRTAATTYTNYNATNGAAGKKSTTAPLNTSASFPVCTTLSVEFLSVSAAYAHGIVTVNWQVDKEVDARDYTVEKSSDGLIFTSAGIVSNKTATAAVNDYSYPDAENSKTPSTLYYRIRETDMDGRPTFSRIVSIDLAGLTSGFTISPNPVNVSGTLHFSLDNAATVQLRILDTKGVLVWQEQRQASAGVNNLELNNLSSLTNGLYLLQVYDGKNRQSLKLMVNH